MVKVNSHKSITDKQLVVEEVVEEIVPRENVAEVVVVIVHRENAQNVQKAKFNAEEEAVVNVEMTVNVAVASMVNAVVVVEVVAELLKEKAMLRDPRVNSAVDVDVVEEVDPEQPSLKVMKELKLNAQNVEDKEADTKESLVKRTIHSIVKMALAVEDVVIRRVAMERETGVKLLPIPTKLQLAINQQLKLPSKEEKENQEKKSNKKLQLLKKKLVSLLMTISQPNKPSPKVSLKRAK
jgi:hypothetical protein